MDRILRFCRQNPQVALFVAICLVFGLGSFIVIVIALATAGSSNTSGEPSGAVPVLQEALRLSRAVGG